MTDRNKKFGDLVQAACRTGGERSLMWALWGEIEVLTKRVDRLEGVDKVVQEPQPDPEPQTEPEDTKPPKGKGKGKG